MRFNNLILIALILCMVVGAPGSTPSLKGDTEVEIDESIPSILIEAAKVKLRRNEGLVYSEGNPFSGYAVTRYPDSSLAEKAGYLNGKRHGTLERWAKNGKPMFQSEYIAGRRDGQTMSWWPNGKIRSVSNFQNDFLHGEVMQWYENGRIFKRLNYNLGKEEGLQKAWRKNGKLYANFEVRNGRTFGLKRANLCFELKDETIALSK